MAKEVITRVTDDLDGTEGAETVTFALKGKTYELDLGPKSMEKLEKALAPFVAKAHVYRPASSAAPKSNGKVTRDWDIIQLREWAGKNKVELPQRGRVPLSIVEQYKAAGGR